MCVRLSAATAVAGGGNVGDHDGGAAAVATSLLPMCVSERQCGKTGGHVERVQRRLYNIQTLYIIRTWYLF